jgi:hypothetical protein
MFSAFRNAALVVSVASLAASLCSATARADIIFDFSGTCTAGCSGTATGVLDLTNAYSFGTPITASTFVSFDYTSSDQAFTIPAMSTLTFTGGLNADGSIAPQGAVLALFNLGAGIFSVDSSSNIFLSASDDRGTSLGFTPVPQTAPEPRSLTLLTIGLAGLGMVALLTRRA